MKPLYVGLAALVAAAGGYYWYSKRTPSKPGTSGAGGLTVGDGSKPGPTELRILDDNQKGLVTTLLANYVVTTPTPLPGCATGALLLGRLPAAGETVDGALRMSAQMANAVAVGDVYVDAATAGAAITGTTPDTVQVTAVDPGPCPTIAGNLRQNGWYLYAKKSG